MNTENARNAGWFNFTENTAMLFYINTGLKKEGPYSAEDLIQQGIKRETLIWAEGYPDWLPAGDIPELAELVKQASPAFKTFGTDTGINEENQAKENRANVAAFIWTIILIAIVALVVFLSKNAFTS